MLDVTFPILIYLNPSWDRTLLYTFTNDELGKGVVQQDLPILVQLIALIKEPSFKEIPLSSRTV